MTLFQYVVTKGDTLYKIANRNQITLQALLFANPLIERGEYIYPGQVLNIPQYDPKKYLVRNGDNLDLIAKKFSLKVQELIDANPQLTNSKILNIGQVIYIPKPIFPHIVQTNQEYGYVELIANIKAIKEKYSFIQTEVIGNSVMGKSIYAIRLGMGEKEVFYSADWHANEYLTGPLLMRFVEDFANAYSKKQKVNGYDIEYLYNNFSIWVVPMVNPDGVEIVQEGITPEHPYYEKVMEINNWSSDYNHWTANIRGVDLNHQWPADWQEENEKSPQVSSPRRYGGERPLTEPETIAIYNFTKNHNFSMVIAFHSQGEIIYWGYKNLEPLESKKIVNRFSNLTGYIPEQSASSAAGYKDWFIQEYRKPGFTVEVGFGINPLDISQSTKIFRQNLSLLLEAPLLI